MTVQPSRFALLNIDDDNDSDSNQKKRDKQGSGKGNKPQSANKKKNKKKKCAQQKEQEELRNLAFARGGKVHSTGSGSSAKDKQVTNDQLPSQQQWKEWKEADKEFVSESYEKDLQQALLLSKLEAEEQKKVQTAIAENETGNACQKAKKKKDKPVTMSLEEFQQDGVKKDSETNSDSRKSSDVVHEVDPTFFKKVEEETHKIIRKEQIQEEYRKQYIVENARTQQYEETIRKKDEQIEQLQKENKKLKADLMEVKERNQQFCMILAQGEMKGKTTVIMELNQLKQVRDELTQEVANLMSELEKERSKVHALKASLDKSKPGKKK